MLQTVSEVGELNNPEYDEETLRRMRTSEIRKRYFLKVARDYNLQEFFMDKDNDAKLKATVEAEFLFGDKRKDEDPEEASNIRWQKFMNVLLPEVTNQKVVDMVNFEHNEYEVMHRNMPFMFKKVEVIASNNKGKTSNNKKDNQSIAKGEMTIQEEKS